MREPPPPLHTYAGRCGEFQSSCVVQVYKRRILHVNRSKQYVVVWVSKHEVGRFKLDSIRAHVDQLRWRRHVYPEPRRAELHKASSNGDRPCQTNGTAEKVGQSFTLIGFRFILLRFTTVRRICPVHLPRDSSPYPLPCLSLPLWSRPVPRPWASQQPPRPSSSSSSAARYAAGS